MAWARLDDGWHDHPKTIEAGLEAAGLWVMCLTWAHKNKRQAVAPGVVPVSVVDRFGGRKARALARRLVQVGYFDDLTDAGWPIHDFSDYLPRYDPQQAAEAGRKGGSAKRHGSKPLGEPPPEPPDDPYGEPLDEPPAGVLNGSEATRADAPASTRRNPVPNPVVQERSAAAARGVTRAHEAAAAADDAIDELQAACTAQGLPVRWDKLSPDQRRQVRALVAQHGVGRLASAAKAQHRPDSPAGFANAWLPAWQALPPPGRRLAAVPEMCLDPAHARQPMPCRLCAADAKAVG